MPLVLPDNPDSVRAIPDADMARIARTHPDAARALNTCVTCKNARSFRWRGEDGEIVDFNCPCADQLLLYLWLLNSGLDLRYQRLSWTDAVGVDERVIASVVDYASNADSYARAGVGLILNGLRGNGKTMIATLLLKRLMADGFDGYFTTFGNLLDLYSSGWRSPEEKGWFDRRIRNAGMLVVDDMGRENDGRIKVAEEAFDSVLRARVAADRPTILTSNKTISELGDLYSLNALSLLEECSVHIEFAGEDFRPRQREIKIDEARQGLTRPVVVE